MKRKIEIHVVERDSKNRIKNVEIYSETEFLMEYGFNMATALYEKRNRLGIFGRLRDAFSNGEAFVIESVAEGEKNIRNRLRKRLEDNINQSRR